jgi:hypothetical protein
MERGKREKEKKKKEEKKKPTCCVIGKRKKHTRTAVPLPPFSNKYILFLFTHINWVKPSPLEQEKLLIQKHPIPPPKKAHTKKKKEKKRKKKSKPNDAPFKGFGAPPPPRAAPRPRAELRRPRRAPRDARA